MRVGTNLNTVPEIHFSPHALADIASVYCRSRVESYLETENIDRYCLEEAIVNRSIIAVQDILRFLGIKNAYVTNPGDFIGTGTKAKFRLELSFKSSIVTSISIHVVIYYPQKLKTLLEKTYE